MTEPVVADETAESLRKVLVPLALAQFICSFAGSNMNVMINDISEDLDTTVEGVQTAITMFLLVMAAFMIPGGKLTDRYGRKRCFMVGLALYGVGALMSAVAPGLGVLILGNSILEGIGTALLIPPVYILTTMLFHDTTSRAKAFGVISGMGGVGAAAGPLLGGFITTAISWRAAFVFQALIIAIIIFLSRKLQDPVPPDPTRPFDTLGAVLSAAGLVALVTGILQADNNLALMAVLMVVGALLLLWFFVHVRAMERKGEEPLLSTSLFKNRTSNLGMITQNIQWLILIGTSFVVATFLQVVRGYNAIQTGVIFTAATVGILVSSLAAERLAKKRPQRTPDRGRLHRHAVRDRRVARHGEGVAQPMGVRPRAPAHRPGSRRDADPVGERGAVELPRRAAGRDLRPVAQRVQPGLVTRHGSRRHDPRRRARRLVVRPGDDCAGRCRGHRTGGRADASPGTPSRPLLLLAAHRRDSREPDLPTTVEWPAHPVVYEVNTAVWLGEVAAVLGTDVTLDAVPAPEWDRVVPDGISVVWLMGVWARSPSGRQIALLNPDLRASWSSALPDWTSTDVVGSPYCITDYVPAAEFGGWAGLDVARAELRARGALLMVDWVPNHVGPDSPWLRERPRGVRARHGRGARPSAGGVRRVDGNVFAKGKDPYFAPWPDVVQVDAFAPSLRSLAVQALSRVAQHADAVRCDMAMLMLDDVVTATWGERVGPPPAVTYWTEVIAAVRRVNPAFRFVAEAYWDREWDLQELGFDYCYDKRLYDRLEQGDVAPVRGHLDADPAYQGRLVRFLENHDEPRAARTFAPPERVKAAAVTIATLPGMTLWHDGQAEGREVFVPVFLGRRPEEPPDDALATWHRDLWAAVAPRSRRRVDPSRGDGLAGQHHR